MGRIGFAGFTGLTGFVGFAVFGVEGLGAVGRRRKLERRPAPTRTDTPTWEPCLAEGQRLSGLYLGS